MNARSCDAPASDHAPMRVADALSLIRGRLTPGVGTEYVTLAQAAGRILAEDVLAPLALPLFDNSAVDGYAVRFEDYGPDPLPIAARVPAGVAIPSIPAGSVARIFTGAPLPPGADTVAMQEDVRLEDGRARLPSGLRRGANCRRAGEDMARGACALPSGRQIGGRDIALAAALGVQGLAVRRRLRIGVFSTGDEVSAGRGALAPAGIHDANRPMLLALLGHWGADARDLGILRDDPAEVRSRLQEATDGLDLIVTSGGVSVGEEDHVRAAVGQVGEINLWRLAIKPGKPLAFGEIVGTPFIGLPGNPFAAYVTALAVLRPVLLHLAGAVEDPPPPSVRSAFSLTKRAGRREYLRVRLVPGDDGLTQAAQVPGGALSGLAGSDGLAELPEDVVEIRPGDWLAFRAHPLG